MNTEEINILDNFFQRQIIDIPLTINQEISYKNKKFNQKSEYAEIIKYIDSFLEGNNINRYIILPGLRGVGKTTMLYQIYSYLLNEKNISPNQILYLSCEELNNSLDCDIYTAIDYYLNEFHHSNFRTLDKEVFLLIDESHFDKNWSLSGKMIYDKSKKIFMIFTGSSAINLEYDLDASRRMIKHEINPLNYEEYLKLKYNFNPLNMSKSIREALFAGEIETLKNDELSFYNNLYNLKNYSTNDWENYFKYGGFPSVMFEDDFRLINQKLYNSIDTVIRKDLGTMKNITSNSETVAWRLLKFLAQKKPGEVSQNTLTDIAKCSFGTVNTLLNLLEKTHLIFHLEANATLNARLKKSWQYYFATPSLRHAINTHSGITNMKKEDYEGILLENLIGSLLFNLKNSTHFFDFNIYFDSNRKGVDFFIKKEFENPIPIEVGRGIKDKKQVIQAMNKNDSPYGIIISNTEKYAKKEDDIIYITPKTFSLL